MGWLDGMELTMLLLLYLRAQSTHLCIKSMRTVFSLIVNFVEQGAYHLLCSVLKVKGSKQNLNVLSGHLKISRQELHEAEWFLQHLLQSMYMLRVCERLLYLTRNGDLAHTSILIFPWRSGIKQACG